MEHERKTRTVELNSRADPHPKKVIPYKEYTACKEAEGRVSTTSKFTLEEEENWDEEPPLPPRETQPGVKPMVLSQEDEWKLMVNQDFHPGSVAGDSGHGTMAATWEDEPIENLLGLWVESMKVSLLSISLMLSGDDDPLFVFNVENVTKPETPAAASTPVQTLEEDEAVSSLESPLGKKPCF